MDTAYSKSMNTTRTLYTLALAMLLGIAAPCYAGAQDTYATLQDAVTAAMSDAEALTDSYEAGGSLYSCVDGTFRYIKPVTDNQTHHIAIPVYAVSGCVLAGLYHTHPEGSKQYSPTDVIGACSVRTQSFIKPRNGDIAVFDCRTLTDAVVKRYASGDRATFGKPYNQSI